jgi:hypothetical protein
MKTGRPRWYRTGFRRLAQRGIVGEVPALPASIRRDAYLRQTGRGELTARQRRRLRHKSNRALP